MYVFDILTGEVKTYISNGSGVCIRDVSWHPNVPVIAATSFSGTVGMYTFDGSVKYKDCVVKSKKRSANMMVNGRVLFGGRRGIWIDHGSDEDQEGDEEDDF